MMRMNFGDLERCPKHGCAMMQVHDLPPVCLIEWLLENAPGRTVRDVVPRPDLPAVILDNGFMLPVERAIRAGSPEEVEIALEEIGGWRVGDLICVPGVNAEAVKLLPPGTGENKQADILLDLDTNVLIYLLFDREIRKLEW